MNINFANENSSRRRIKKSFRRLSPLVNCDSKANQCNLYSTGASFGGQKGSKLSINDESSHPINGSNTNNKSERKRNIKMLGDEEKIVMGDGMVNEGDARDSTKRIKVEVNGDGHDDNKTKMFQSYQPWVLSTYGDQSKSKTITLRKQSRIVSALKGLESNRPDSSKFRFWVKSKGFMLELPEEYQHVKQNQIVDDGCLLFIPSKLDVNNVIFKRVAVVEYFFSVIYKVHCSSIEEGRHVGQKRTYRKITECYSFLPREAVTKFLTQCDECRKGIKLKIDPILVKSETADGDDENHSDETSNQRPLSKPKNGDNYFELMKALHENFSLLSRIKSIPDHSNGTGLEVFKENIVANDNRRSNQERKEQISQNDLNKTKKVADGSRFKSSFQDTKELRVSSSNSPLFEDFADQFVSSSLSDPSDDDDRSVLHPSSSSSTSNNNNNSPLNNAIVVPTRAANGPRVDILETVPDDISSDYHNMKARMSATCDDNSAKYSSSEINTKRFQWQRGKASRKSNNSAGDIKPITSTYLLMTRSMGLDDEDALNLDSITSQSEGSDAVNLEESYANLLKDADKLKLMLLAWNYQNSAAVRNGTSGPDLATMTNLWEQYQNALGISVANKSNEPGSPSPSNSQEDVNSPSDNKEEDEGSEDESDERMDQATYDPERLKAFNMFVRLFVDENLDRMIPISKQPKEKVQAIIDSCARQFPDFSERARKRLRTYLKSCRRNKKTKDGWEHQPSRPTPAHLTSVQAEKLLSMACENESLNAKRMRIGLEPISQSLNIPSSHASDVQSAQSLYTTAKGMDSLTTPLSISSNISNCKTSPIISTTTDSNANSINSTMGSARALSSTLPFDFSSLAQKSENVNSTCYFNNSPFSSPIAQGPTDLSVKRTLLPHNLNVTESMAVKQLITGYRESAAFLLRSADELEQLLLNQQ